MKHTLQTAGKFLLLYGLTLLLLWGILFLSALIPNDSIATNMHKSAIYYQKLDPFQLHNGEKLNAIGDNYADAIVLNLAWHMGNGNPLISVLDTQYYDGGAFGEHAGLYLSVTEDASPNADYTRYWHGNAAFVRMMHLFTDIGGMKTIGFVVALLLVALTVFILIKGKHTDLALLLVISLIAVQFWNIRLSLEYQPVFVLTFALCPAYLLAERRGNGMLPLLSILGGTAVAFFDFLTTETLTILVPLLLVVAVRGKENRLAGVKENLSLLGGCAACWCAAYGATFLVKWAVASLVTGNNAFALATTSAVERIGGIAGTAPNGSTFFPAITANLTVLFGGTARLQPARALLGTALCIVLLFSIWYLFRAKQSQKTAALLLLLLGAVVPVRFLLLNNHSYYHEFFTYRALLAPILATLLALRLNLQQHKRKAKK